MSSKYTYALCSPFGFLCSISKLLRGTIRKLISPPSGSALQLWIPLFFANKKYPYLSTDVPLYGTRIFRIQFDSYSRK
jgi:hypothetical protein